VPRKLSRGGFGFGFEVLLLLAHEGELFGGSLESTVSELGGGVDETEVDLFLGGPRGLRDARLSEGDDPLLGSDDAALDHDVVLLDDTVVWEATEWGDGLLGDVGGGLRVEVGGVAFSILLDAGGDPVDLLVHLGTVVVSVLTGTGHREEHTGRVPCTDAGNLTETLVSLTWELLGAPSVGDTFETVTLGDAEDVDHLRFVEDLLDRDGLLHVLPGPGDLGCRVGTAVELDLHDVSLLLTKVREQVNLGVRDDTDDLAVLGNLAELLFVRLLTGVGGEELVVLVEGLLLGGTEVLVEPTLARFGHGAAEDSVKLTETSWSLHVANNTNDDHWWSLDDGDWFDNLLLVGLGAWLVHFSNDVGHTSLVALEGSQVHRCGLVSVPWPRSDFAAVVGAPLSRQEPEGAVTWG
jgi:hypothetical protein